MTVAAGATVMWTNRDPFAHTVTPLSADEWGSDGSGDDMSAWMQEGDTWSFTFSEPGTYVYRCIPHSYQDQETGEWKGQLGTVVVV